ncbi:MAG: family 20 glycosylhydrolase [Phycisphaeraceae bacterium JB051]
MHGLMIDSARAMERPEYYKRLFHFMAQRGADTVLWHFTDDQGCSLVFDTLPQSASPNALTKAQMRELLEVAQSLGLQVIPELETYGHTRFITNLPEYAHLREGNETFSGMCPVLPETRQIISKLIKEVAELFDSPWIHVGMDEVVVGDHPQTAKALKQKTSAQLYAEHAKFVYDQVQSHGKKMMMWSDHIVKDASIADNLPRDIVIAAWHYTAKVDPELIMPHLRRGFDVLLCGAMISYDQMLYPGKDYGLANLRTMAEIERMPCPGPGKIIGQVTTIWTPTRYMHDSLWLAKDLALAILKHGPDVDSRKQAAAFARDYYGIEPTNDWLDAVDTLYRLSPMHHEWIALLRGHDADGKLLQVSGQAIVDWQKAHEAVANLRDQVKQNQTSYDTFCLTLDMVAALHQRATDCQSGQFDQAMQTTKRLIDSVQAVWDRERYADDSRKFYADWERDRPNHLIEQLHVGEAFLKQRINREVPSCH